MLLLCLSLGYVELQNGEEMRIELQENKAEVFELKTSPRDTVRWYFESEMNKTAQMYICQLDEFSESACRTSARIKEDSNSTGHTYKETHNSILFNNVQKLFVMIESNEAQAIRLVIHAAIELGENRTFKASKALAQEFEAASRTFAYFTGTSGDLRLYFECEHAQNLTLKHSYFDLSSNTVIMDRLSEQTESGTKSYNLTVKGSPGWLYVTVDDPGNYSIQLSERKAPANLTINVREKEVSALLIDMSRSYAIFYVNKTDLANQHNLTVAGFTESPELFGDVEMEISGRDYPGGLFYADDGSVDLSMNSASKSLRGAVTLTSLNETEFSSCVGVMCKLYIMLSFNRGNYILSKDKTHYQEIAISTVVQFNAEVANNIPGRLTIAISSLDGYTENIIVNENVQRVDVDKTTRPGYLFQLKDANGQSADIRGTVLNGDVPSHNGVTMHRLGSVLQALVTEGSGYYFSRGGFYFANLKATANYNGTLYLAQNFELQPNACAQVKHVRLNSNLFYSFNVSGLRDRRFMTCLEVDNGALSELNESSFAMYASARYYMPDEQQNDLGGSFNVLQLGSTIRYCLHGQTDRDHDMVYVSVKSVFYSHHADFEDACLRYGEPFYFADEIRFDKPATVDVSGLGVFMVNPPLYLDNKVSMLQRTVYFEMGVAGQGAAGYKILDYNDHNSVIYQQNFTQQFAADTFEMPIDQQLLLVIIATGRVTMYINHVYERMQSSLATLAGYGSSAIFKVDLEENTEYVLGLRELSGGPYRVQLKDLNITICRETAYYHGRTGSGNCTAWKLNTTGTSEKIVLGVMGATGPATKTGVHYVTVQLRETTQELRIVEFELFDVVELKEGHENQLTLQADPVLSTLGLEDTSWYVLGLTIEIEAGFSSQLHLNLSCEVPFMCISYDKPVSYDDYVRKDTSRCFKTESNVSFVSTELTHGRVGQRRIFLSVLGNSSTKTHLTNVWAAEYLVAPEHGSSAAGGGYEAFSTRLELDRKRLVLVNTKNTTAIAATLRLAVSANEYEQMLRAGRLPRTQLLASTGAAVRYVDAVSDDSKVVQMTSLSIPESSKMVFFKMEPLVVGANDIVELNVSDDTVPMPAQLDFMSEEHVAGSGAHRFRFAAGHLPVLLELEYCRVHTGSVTSVYSSPFTTAPGPSDHSWSTVVRFNAATDGYLHHLVAPIDGIQFYEDTNVFFTVENDDSAAVDYRISIIQHSERPTLSNDSQQLVVDTDRDSLIVKFIPASLSYTNQNITVINGEPSGYEISYKLFMVTKSDDYAVLTTECGLEAAGATNITDWFKIDGDPSLQETMQLEVNKPGKSWFVLLARNDANGQVIAYTPVRANEVEYNKVNTTVVVFGVLFSIAGVVIIVLLTLWIMRLKKRAKQESVYKSITDGI